ncbi:MAG: hypothetical protein RBR35_03280, partial [Salinivirgaceae bacterium]|nr:hypothetical protein [Salinivirgaceae bacterium]
PKYGIHWSHYGMLLATDSLINYIEEKRNIVMPHLEFTKIRCSSNLKFTDYDIAGGMNLLFQMHSEPMCYPDIKFTTSDYSIKPKTLVVSDSFYWSMFNIGVGNNVFSFGGFWFYNKQIYPDSFKSTLYTKDIDIAQKTLENDVVILMTTDANLPNFSWGFVENMVQVLLNKDIHLDENVIENQKEERIRQMIQVIRDDTNWFDIIKKKAKERNISIDSMLVIDANWMLEQKK